MANVTRTGQGTNVQSTIVIRLVQIILQRYPGTLGTNAERALATIPYKVFHNGVDQKVAGATSASDGSIFVILISGTKVELEIFGSRYEIKALNALEDPATTKGVQRRLDYLGYPVNGIDGAIGPKSDAEILNFQGDANLPTLGSVDTTLQNKLKSAVGA